MNNRPLKNIGRLTLFEIKNNKKAIIGWCIAIFGIIMMYMTLFPSVKDMAQVKIDSMPQELLDFMGMTSFSDMANYTVYFGIIFNILLIAISIFAATFAAGALYREERGKTIEFLNSLNVSRSEIYSAKLICSVLSVTALLVLSGIGVMLCGALGGGDTFYWDKCLKILCISGFSAYFFMALSIMAAGAVSRINAPTVGAMAVLACYVVGYLGKLLEDKAQWLKYLSPFEVFSPERAMAFEDSTLITLGVYSAVSVLFIIIGGIGYRRRDLHI